MPAERVVLIRHGQSLWNATGRWQGHGGVGLSDLGNAQAAATAAFLAEHEPGITRVVSSDLPRVTQTAAPLVRVLGHPLETDERLREIDVGWWSGLTTAEIEARDPETFARWRAGEDVARGDAETDAELSARITAAVEDLRGQCDGTLVVFCHGGPVRAMVAATLGLPVAVHRMLGGPDNCSRTVVTHNGSARLRQYNETAHLAALA